MLAFEAFRIGGGRNFGSDSAVNAGAHFVSGGVGESDDKHFVDVTDAGSDELNNAFDESGGFAGTGGGGDEQIFIAALNCGGLLTGKIHKNPPRINFTLQRKNPRLTGISRGFEGKDAVDAAEKFLVLVDQSHDARRAAFGTENGLNLVGDELFDIVAPRSDVLAGIKMFGMSLEVFADTSGHSEAEVGVDVNFADSGLRGFAELVFRNANGVVEFAVIVVDNFDVLRNNGGSAVEDNRELRDFLFDFGEDVEAQGRVWV